MEYAERVKRLPPYLFAQMEKLKAEKRKQGVDLIALGIGDPDLPTPQFVIDAIEEELKKDDNHKYPSSEGESDYREAVASWMKTRFGVDVDAEKEVCCCSGSKEAIANIARAFVNPGDRVLCPDPAYPVYAQGATVFCDGEPVKMPLKRENEFLPELEKFSGSKAKMIYLNYPNNPIGATAPTGFMKEAQGFADKEKLVYCYDNAYSEFTFDGYQAPSALEFGENVAEFHSFSKTFNMTGDRIGFVVGNEKIVSGLKKVKSQIDSGTPMYLQRACIKAMQAYDGKKPPSAVLANMKEYEKRRDLLCDGLRKLGFDAQKPKATFYFWLPIEGSSMEFCKKLLDVGVVITPGVGFGENGEGYVRFALTQPIPRIKEALERMEKIF